MRILVLEDNDFRIGKFRDWFSARKLEDVTIVKSAAEAIAAFSTGHFDLVFLDHDLGENQECKEPPDINSGTEVVKHMVENKHLIQRNTTLTVLPPIHIDRPRVFIHSLNTYRATVMQSDLAAAGYEVERVPFTHMAHWIEFILDHT